MKFVVLSVEYAVSSVQYKVFSVKCEVLSAYLAMDILCSLSYIMCSKQLEV